MKRTLTLIEFIVLITVILIFIGLLLPTISTCHGPRRRIQCLNNLRQIGLGIKQYAMDHNEQCPEGGAGTLSAHFRLLSNMVGNAGQIFHCPNDKGKKLTNTVHSIEDWNISYCYVRGLDDNAAIDTPLAFDRDLGGTAADGYPLRYFAGQSWTTNANHKSYGGNILFAGAHVTFNTSFPDTRNAIYTNIVEVP